MATFNPSSLTGYGTQGLETAKSMQEALGKNGLKLFYDSKNKQFTILNSLKVAPAFIKEIFNTKKYHVWFPKLENRTDLYGNRIVTLSMNDPNEFNQFNPLLGSRQSSSISASSKKYPGFAELENRTDLYGDGIVELGMTDSNKFSQTNPLLGSRQIGSRQSPSISASSRKDIADDLMSKLNGIDIAIINADCIDVGCRSGEITKALNDKGAHSIVGIDPDDSEFSTGMKIGLKKHQLIKATLQDYIKENPKIKFDLATVFLFNIHLREREEFLLGLANVIKPSGAVVIGIGAEEEDLFLKDRQFGILPILDKCFNSVREYRFQGSLNEHLVKCESPKKNK